MKFQAYCYLAIMGISSCKTISSSSLDHEQGRPFRANTSAYYEPADEDAFYDFVSHLSNYDKDDYLDKDHPLSRRAQFWINKIDKIVIDLDLKNSINIPSPVVKILKNNESRAHTQAKPQCTTEPVIHINPDPSAPESSIGNFTNKTSKVCRYVDRSYKHALAVAPKIKKRLTQKGFSCGDVAPAKDSNIGVMNCKSPDQIQNLIINGGYYKTMFPYITIHTGLIEEVSEEQFIAVLAHELGHYYRNHDSADLFPGEYDFFFRLSEHDAGEKPRPANLNATEKFAVTKFMRAISKKRGVLSAEKRLVELGLGQYTTEEEADHFAAEMLNRLGLNPMNFVKFWIKKAESNECKERLNNSFSSDQKKFENPKYIKLSTSHHDHCYRAFSTYKDLTLHNYTPPTGRYIEVSEISGWKEMEAELPWDSRVDIIKALNIK